MLRRLLVVAVVVVALAGCGGGRSAYLTSLNTNDPTRSVAPVATTAGSREPTARAWLLHPAKVYGSIGGKVLETLGTETRLGSHRVLLVLDQYGDWVQVALPTRPNGSTGWVHAADVRVELVQDWIKVDRARFTITVKTQGRAAVTGRVAVGSKANPTPGGYFFVTDLVPHPGGAYGQWALGLSAHSPTLSEFGGADGQVGIHGTNQPALLGSRASHGCVRVAGSVIPALERVHLGSPVTIT